MSNEPYVILTHVLDRPARNLILKRGKMAEDYFAYCGEAGCETWGILGGIKGALGEPLGLWLPDGMRPQGTSVYVQGVEVPANYDGPIPEGFEMIAMPPCKLLMFQGPPYKDADFCEAIKTLRTKIESYDPELYGYAWADADAPRIQLEPKGSRGYIEGRPVRPIGQ